MVLDGLSPPIGLTSVTARINGTQILMEGFYEPGLATPILVWPKSEAWFNPCKRAKDLCCLRDVNRIYRNDALKKAQGTNCLTTLPANLVAGSRENVVATRNSFQAIVPLQTSYVAILFVHMKPFFILDGFQEFKIVPSGDVSTSLVIANNPCYSVVVPGTLASVCMQCNNALPANAYYVWTPSWYNDYRCSWLCNPNYAQNGNYCEQAVSETVPLRNVIVGVVAGVTCLIALIYCNLKRTRRVQISEPMNIPETTVASKKDIIQFRDDWTPVQTLRFKNL